MAFCPETRAVMEHIHALVICQKRFKLNRIKKNSSLNFPVALPYHYFQLVKLCFKILNSLLFLCEVCGIYIPH